MRAILIFPLLVVVTLNGANGKPSGENLNSQETGATKTLADGEEENPFNFPDEFDGFELNDPFQTEDFGRFTVTEVGTMMCYRAWELDSKKDFHICNVCFNNTNYPSNKLGKDDYIAQVDSCINTYLSDTEFKSCQPMLKDPTIPNKSYDILVSEPPFDFPFRNFARCAHGVALKQEAVKCVDNADAVQGTDAFLEKFGCLLNNLIIESRRFSAANMQELLGSVSQRSGKDNSSPTSSREE